MWVPELRSWGPCAWAGGVHSDGRGWALQSWRVGARSKRGVKRGMFRGEGEYSNVGEVMGVGYASSLDCV